MKAKIRDFGQLALDAKIEGDKLKLEHVMRHHLDDIIHGRIIGKLKGQKMRYEFNIAHSIVSRLWSAEYVLGVRDPSIMTSQ